MAQQCWPEIKPRLRLDIEVVGRDENYGDQSAQLGPGLNAAQKPRSARRSRRQRSGQSVSSRPCNYAASAGAGGGGGGVASTSGLIEIDTSWPARTINSCCRVTSRPFWIQVAAQM